MNGHKQSVVPVTHTLIHSPVIWQGGGHKIRLLKALFRVFPGCRTLSAITGKAQDKWDKLVNHWQG